MVENPHIQPETPRNPSTQASKRWAFQRMSTLDKSMHILSIIGLSNLIVGTILFGTPISAISLAFLAIPLFLPKAKI